MGRHDIGFHPGLVPQIFGKTVLDWMQWQPFQRYGERSLGNVFTTYYAFIFDWGIAGAMLAIVLIAALSQLCYESAVFALQYGKAGIPISMMLYGAIGYCCAFSFSPTVGCQPCSTRSCSETSLFGWC